ncbi:MAG: hypothetical protein DYG98_21970 [Haliscomenobacteraceae bacterium CHB4]|nr:hypothetical protein [Saprospiraceae bacterium]MCE7925728.1 hypothetical protein [Haliscomenobacteraceae bacterium CHB4]
MQPVGGNDIPPISLYFVNNLKYLKSCKNKSFVFSPSFSRHYSNVIFYEPMVAVDFIKTKPHKHFTVRQPQKFVPAGYYPLEYCVRWNAETQQYEIALDDLTKQE